MKKIAAALATLLCLIASAQATTLSFTSIDNGWYNETGGHESANKNTFTGSLEGLIYNSFFNFNLSGLEGQEVTSATLTIEAANGRYGSIDTSEQLEIWDVTGTPGQGPSVDFFKDLMTGTKFGQSTVSGTYYAAMPEVVVTLNSAAYTDMLGDNEFSVGAHLSSIEHPDLYEEAVWSASLKNGVATLTLEVQPNDVPEPSTLALFGIAWAGLSALRRRTSK